MAAESIQARRSCSVDRRFSLVQCQRTMQILWFDPDRPDTWSEHLRSKLIASRQWSEPWFNESPDRAGTYDRLHEFLTPELGHYALRGWHCTRLLDVEVLEILKGGLQVLSEDLLLQRIDAAHAAGELTDEVAARLRAGHHAGQRNRRGQLWFGFSSNLPDESAISPLLRNWGGEAMYWAHANDVEIAPVLQNLGRPTVIDAWVPISGLRAVQRLVDLVCQVDLQAAGLLERREVGNYEDCSTEPVLAENIIAITQYPGTDFERRTRCLAWREPLK